MPPHIIYIMGVSGAGKTTIGKLLSAQTGIPFFDADDFHSTTNKEKMKTGIPLTDDDRKDWLLQLNHLANNQSNVQGAIIACSALKEKYRIVLSKDIKPYWIFLHGTYEQLHYRIIKRRDHYMPINLLTSQLETLEIPTDALTINIMQQQEEIVNSIINYLQKYL